MHFLHKKIYVSIYPSVHLQSTHLSTSKDKWKIVKQSIIYFSVVAASAAAACIRLVFLGNLSPAKRALFETKCKGEDMKRIPANFSFNPWVLAPFPTCCRSFDLWVGPGSPGYQLDILYILIFLLFSTLCLRGNKRNGFPHACLINNPSSSSSSASPHSLLPPHLFLAFPHNYTPTTAGKKKLEISYTWGPYTYLVSFPQWIQLTLKRPMFYYNVHRALTKNNDYWQLCPSFPSALILLNCHQAFIPISRRIRYKKKVVKHPNGIQPADCCFKRKYTYLHTNMTTHMHDCIHTDGWTDKVIRKICSKDILGVLKSWNKGQEQKYLARVHTK